MNKNIEPTSIKNKKDLIKIVVAFLIIILILTLLGYGIDTIRKMKIVGTYRYTILSLEITYTLNGDGSCLSSLYPSQSGTWKISDLDNNIIYLYFKNNNNNDETTKYIKAEITKGGIIINNHFYEKIT